MKKMNMIFAVVGIGVMLGFLAGCGGKPPPFQEAFPKEGWHTYSDTTRGVTCYFYVHPKYPAPSVYFGAGCVPDTQWKKGN